VAYFALVVGAMVAGDAVRARRALQVAIAEEAEREREALTQHRFDEERLTWAHELHDILGHALVAINIRASAAAHLERQPRGGDAVMALDEIAAVSAEALGELRSTLKNLRNTGGQSAPLRPLQDLSDLRDLVAGVEQAGLAIDLEMSEVTSGVPATIGHAGYRIVQEGLTNVLRHSTAQRASVRVGVDEGALIVEVFDAGVEKAPGERHGGHGVRGMKERTVALGGWCEVGAVDGAGWRVRARIPLARQDP
jgi:signal transduction histidine kinase